MDAFIDLPTWAETSAGTGDIAAGFWATFSPLIFWGFVIGLAPALIIIFIAIFKNSLEWANQNWFQKKNNNWIKSGSIEDLANKHYGTVGQQREQADRIKLQKKYS